MRSDLDFFSSGRNCSSVCVCLLNVCDGGGGEDLFFISGNSPRGVIMAESRVGAFSGSDSGVASPLGGSGSQQALVLCIGQLQT